MPYKDPTKRKETQKRSDEARKDWRARAWQCVVYKESAPEGWMETLHKQCVPYDISPLHDKDKQPDGTPKKPHWHVVLDWGAGATVSGDRAIEVFNSIGGVYPQPSKDRQKFLTACKVKKLDSAQRYLCHLDEHDPDKHHYDPADVVSGHQELPYVERTLTAMERDELALSMIDYIDELGIYDFAALVRSARRDHPEWMHALINDGKFVDRYLRGKQAARREEREEVKALVAISRHKGETGEAIADVERWLAKYFPGATVEEV